MIGFVVVVTILVVLETYLTLTTLATSEEHFLFNSYPLSNQLPPISFIFHSSTFTSKYLQRNYYSMRFSNSSLCSFLFYIFPHWTTLNVQALLEKFGQTSLAFTYYFLSYKSKRSKVLLAMVDANMSI